MQPVGRAAPGVYSSAIACGIVSTINGVKMWLLCVSGMFSCDFDVFGLVWRENAGEGRGYV